MTTCSWTVLSRLKFSQTRARRNPRVLVTKGIQHEQMKQDQFYIKRMVVMPGDHVSIGDDRHLVINGVRLVLLTPHFENVYSFDPKTPPRESKYSGHVNGTVARQYFITCLPTSHRAFRRADRFHQ